jgi:hypothetical protein
VVGKNKGMGFTSINAINIWDHTSGISSHLILSLAIPLLLLRKNSRIIFLR